MNENRNGFYGDDGEFYLEGSQSAEMYKKAHSTEDLYPKRPDISYTTEPLRPEIKVVPDEPENVVEGNTKFCKFCGKNIPFDAVVCTHCGRQVETLKQENSPAQANNTYIVSGKPAREQKNPCVKNKWIAFFLCLFLGEFGIHKFYEGKIILGILYLCTGGLFGIGWILDCIGLFFKPNPYTV
ncbi:MAG: NINE protein [Oscillospiraceae bacterium]